MKKLSVYTTYEQIQKLYTPGTLSHYYLICHGEAVAKKSLEIADRFPNDDIDRDFLYSASMLHDIGMIFTYCPECGCNDGEGEYILHGLKGAEYLRSLQLDEYARVAECHIGMGIKKEEVAINKLPFPEKDYLPETLEETIVTFADKFFSKVPKWLTTPKPIAHIVDRLPSYAVGRFLKAAVELGEITSDEAVKHSECIDGAL